VGKERKIKIWAKPSNIAIKRSFAVGKIWMEKSARFRNLLIAVKLSEGLNFSATFRSEAEEKFKVKKSAYKVRSTIHTKHERSAH
jgi:hypothetical protein